MRPPQMDRCTRAAVRRLTAARLRRGGIASPAILVTALVASRGAAIADTAPKRGGTLEFAVVVEPGNYDCHANFSVAFLHPIAQHSSTLLKFDAPNYPQIVGDLAEAWSVSSTALLTRSS